MTLNDLLPELLKLTRDEQVEAIKILQHEVSEKQSTQSGADVLYEFWSPQITPEGSKILMDMLREDKKKHG